MKHNNETVERRYLTIPTELRAADAEGRTVVGSAAVFNAQTDMRWYKEQIDPSAFDDVLADDNSDVVALFNHDTNLVLARRSSGTLKIWKEENKLMYQFEAPNTTAGNDLLESLKRGDIRSSSFAFEVSEQKWVFDEADDRNDLRTILKVSKLWDVSPVTFPAYEDTEVAKRSRPAKSEKPVFAESEVNARMRMLELENKL
jgi:hypothetical protein